MAQQPVNDDKDHNGADAAAAQFLGAVAREQGFKKSVHQCKYWLGLVILIGRDRVCPHWRVCRRIPYRCRLGAHQH